MARTPLASFFQRLHNDITLSQRTGLPVDELRDMRVESILNIELSRRNFLRGAGLALGATLTFPLINRAASSNTSRIAIVGGGLAGLSAGITLQDAGYDFILYEASPVRAGGRMMSSKGDVSSTCTACHNPQHTNPQAPFLDNQVVDVFAELIDTDHTTMQALAKRYGLTLTNLIAGQPAGTTDTFHIRGSYYSTAAALRDYRNLYPALQRDLKSAGYPTTYNKSTAAGRTIDKMSVWQYIESRVPGGHSSRLGRLLDAAYVIEYGADTTDQSALNILYLLGNSPHNEFEIFGEADEAFHIRGGCQQLTDAMAASLCSKMRLGHQLHSIARNSNGTYSLLFSGSSQAVSVDVVLLAIPFSILRRIDYSRAGFDALKNTAIQNQGQGHDGKLQLQFNQRFWNKSGPWGRSNGNVYTDFDVQDTWEVTRGEPGTRGILAFYTGGSVTDSLAQNHPVGLNGSMNVQADCLRFLKGIERVFPGLTATWNGRAVGSLAHKSEYFRTAYSYWRVGQYQTFVGYERVPQGNVFFAGEHTSVDFGGYMEGAAREGIDAAKAIIGRLV